MKLSTWLVIIVIFGSAWAVVNPLEQSQKPLETVEVDLQDYQGKWYSVYSIPTYGTFGCERPIANYNLTDKGVLKVENSCDRFGIWDSSIEGEARPQTNASAGKYVVEFGMGGVGKYHVMMVEEDRYALVGSPDRDSLFILSREPSIDNDLRKRLLEEASRQGFEVTRLHARHQEK